MKVTIVSTLPVEVNELKPGLIPGHFVIPAAKKDDISVLVIDDSRQLFLGADPEAPPFVVVEPSSVIAESIINDFRQASVGASLDKNINGISPLPGLFWVPGEFTIKEVKEKFKSEITNAFTQTRAWFENLVYLADDVWTKTQQRKLITDMQRVACRSLNIERPWDFDVAKIVSTLCWSCKSSVNSDAIICGTCKAILNKEEYEKNKTRFVTA